MQREALHFVYPGHYEEVEICTVNYYTLRFLEEWAGLVRSIKPEKVLDRRVMGEIEVSHLAQPHWKEVKEGDVVVKFKDGSLQVYNAGMASAYISQKRGNHG